MFRAMIGVAVLVLANCADNGARAFRALSRGEQNAFEACWAPVRAQNCQEAATVATRDECMERIAARYAQGATAAARRDVLVSLGCPAPLFDAIVSAAN